MRSYYDHELPAIGVKVTGSRRVLDATSGHFDKFFSYVCHIINRAGDLDEGVNTVQEILSAAENVIESQYQPGRDLHRLGTHANIRGGPIVTLANTDIGFRLLNQLEAEIVAIIKGEIEIITA